MKAGFLVEWLEDAIKGRLAAEAALSAPAMLFVPVMSDAERRLRDWMQANAMSQVEVEHRPQDRCYAVKYMCWRMHRNDCLLHEEEILSMSAMHYGILNKLLPCTICKEAR